MRHSFAKAFAAMAALSLALWLSAAYAAAQGSKRLKDAERHSNRAAQVFDRIMAVREKMIPRRILDRAEAIAVFPGVVKAAFIVGGRGGQGVISRRVKGGWSAPAFFNLGGGSVGLQIGAQKTDYVMLIMNEDGVKGLMEDKFEMGGEGSIAAGPVGREAAVSTNATMDAGILSYSVTKGLFAGVALKGAVISPDNDLNEAVYGKKGREVLETIKDINEMPEEVRLFPVTLSRYSRR